MLVKFKRNGHVCPGFLFIRTPCIIHVIFSTKELRAPLVVVGDGHYTKLSKEFRTNDTVVSDCCVIFLFLKNYVYHHNIRYIENCNGQPHAQVSVFNLNDRETRCMIWLDGETPANVTKFCQERVLPFVTGIDRGMYKTNNKVPPKFSH